jgi:hypothetical protein
VTPVAPDVLDGVARDLRSCAQQLRTAAAAAERLLQPVPGRMTPKTWHGPYADRVENEVAGWRTGVARTVAAMLDRAAAWGRDAHELEGQAATARTALAAAAAKH